MTVVERQSVASLLKKFGSLGVIHQWKIVFQKGGRFEVEDQMGMSNVTYTLPRGFVSF